MFIFPHLTVKYGSDFFDDFLAECILKLRNGKEIWTLNCVRLLWDNIEYIYWLVFKISNTHFGENSKMFKQDSYSPL